MTLHHITRWAKQEWYWPASLLGVLALAAMMAASDSGQSDATIAQAATTPAKAVQAQALPATFEAVQAKKDDKALALIASYETRVNDQPSADDAPAYLMAMGNLYRQKLQDYTKAAEQYERLLADYPDWDGSRKAYLQLVTCYERLGELAKRDSVYRRMLDVFPADSKEYEFAEHHLKTAF